MHRVDNQLFSTPQERSMYGFPEVLHPKEAVRLAAYLNGIAIDGELNFRITCGGATAEAMAEAHSQLDTAIIIRKTVATVLQLCPVEYKAFRAENGSIT